MGSLFSKQPTTQTKQKSNVQSQSTIPEQPISNQNQYVSTRSDSNNRQNSSQYGDCNETTKIITKSDMNRHNQSKGENNSSQICYSTIQDKGNEKSFIQQQQSIEQQDQIVEEIKIDKSGVLMRSQSKLEKNIYCYYCQENIYQDFIRVNCTHTYHNNCFIQYVSHLIQGKNSTVLKCICGTKISSNVLRQINEQQTKMKSLYQLFTAQLNLILQSNTIKKSQQYKEIMNLFNSNESKEDCDYCQVDFEEREELKKRVQEYNIDASGILSISQSKLLIIDFCLYCTKEVYGSKVSVVCGHFYHSECFLQWIEQQVLTQRKQFIKCRCGSKLNPNLIRQLTNISEMQKPMRLLNNLFSSQLSKVLVLLRKKDEYAEIMDLFFKHQNTEDYSYTSSTGFMYYSNYSTPGGD